MQITLLSDMVTTQHDWLWQGRLARGMITILEGDPGVGKGLLAMDIAARLTRGLPMPGEDAAGPSTHVLLCSLEDNAATLSARAIAAGSDPQRLSIVNASNSQ